MKMSDLYPYYEKSILTLASAIGYLSSEDLNKTVFPFSYTIKELVLQILEFNYQWLNLININKGEFTQFGNNTESIDLDEQLSLIISNINNYLAKINVADLDNFYTLDYCRGSVEVHGKFTIRYILWKIVEHTIHNRGQIFTIMQTSGTSVPSLW